jgi:hypothetical protein
VYVLDKKIVQIFVCLIIDIYDFVFTHGPRQTM